MRPRPERYKLTGFDSVMKYLGMLMASLYIIVGVAIIWKSSEFIAIPKKFAIPLGATMIFYGTFRGYRNYQRYF